MKTSVEVNSETAIVAVVDAATSLPAGLDQDALLRELKPLAVARRAFYFVTDDPIRMRLDLYAGEAPPPTLERHFEPLGGTFGLEVRSREVAVVGWNKDGSVNEARCLVPEAGSQALGVLDRRPFDARRHDKEMIDLVGEENYRFYNRASKTGLVGCLPLALTALAVLARQWEWLWYLVPLVILSWLPYVVLKNTQRYKAVERQGSELETARPLYVMTLTPTDQADLKGGFLRI